MLDDPLATESPISPSKLVIDVLNVSNCCFSVPKPEILTLFSSTFLLIASALGARLASTSASTICVVLRPLPAFKALK